MPEIFVVHDSADEVGHRDFLQALPDTGDGVLVASVTPGNRSTKGLTTDLLAGLGKQTGIGASDRHLGERWPKAIAWLVAERVESVVVSRAHLLDGRAWQVLCELACSCDFDLYLVVQRGSLTRGQTYQTERWPVELINWPQFEARWSKEPAVRHHMAAPSSDEFPHLPSDEFTTFGAACRSYLSPEDLSQVESEVAAARAAIRSWLKPELEEEGLATFLAELVESCVERDRALARLRGAQLELFVHGYLLKVRIDMLAGALEARSLPQLNSASAKRLRAFTSTSHPAAATLALVGGLGPDQLTSCNVGDVAEDGARLRSGDIDLEIPAEAQPMILAHRLFRLMEGAKPDDPLFLSEIRRPGQKSYRRTPPAIMHALLATASSQSGLVLTRRHERATAHHAWMKRRGISIQQLRPASGTERAAR
jgi:hypothetical protein